MAYKVSFGDRSPEGRFWDTMYQKVVQIGTSEADEADYFVTGGMGQDPTTHMPTLRVRRYGELDGAPVGDGFDLPLTGEESVHVY